MNRNRTFVRKLFILIYALLRTECLTPVKLQLHQSSQRFFSEQSGPYHNTESFQCTRRSQTLNVNVDHFKYNSWWRLGEATIPSSRLLGSYSSCWRACQRNVEYAYMLVLLLVSIKCVWSTHMAGSLRSTTNLLFLNWYWSDCCSVLLRYKLAAWSLCPVNMSSRSSCTPAAPAAYMKCCCHFSFLWFGRTLSYLECWITTIYNMA